MDLEAYKKLREEELKSLSFVQTKEDFIRFLKEKTIPAEEVLCHFLQNFEISLPDVLPENGFGHFTAEKEGSSYHFVFDELMPKKLYPYQLSAKEISLFIDQLRAAYRFSLLRADLTIEPLEQVRLTVIHHFKGQIRDLDNFELKFFIDVVLVGGGFLKDDSPKYLKILQSVYKEKSPHEYTELWIDPIKKNNKR